MTNRPAWLATLLLLLAGCNGPTVLGPVNGQHLYVGNDSASGLIAQYTLPLSSSSTPNLTFSSANVESIAVDANCNVATADNTGNLTEFRAPLNQSSNPFAIFKNGSATGDGQLVFNSSNNLYAATAASGDNVFVSPLLSSSTVSSSITNPAITASGGTGLDSSGNLYITSTGATSANLYVFSPPYTGTPTVTPAAANTAYRSLAINGSQLFVASNFAGNGKIDVYTLPLTTASAPAFSITTGISTPEAVAVDQYGNLYVANLGTSTISAYYAPFSASSTPVVTLTVGAGTWSLQSLAIGC